MLQNDNNVATIRKEQHIQRHGVVSNKALPSSLFAGSKSIDRKYKACTWIFVADIFRRHVLRQSIETTSISYEG